MAREGDKWDLAGDSPRAPWTLLAHPQHRRLKSVRVPPVPFTQHSADRSLQSYPVPEPHLTRQPPWRYSRKYGATSPPWVVSHRIPCKRSRISYSLGAENPTVTTSFSGARLSFSQARVHGRNFVVPYVDALTALLSTRFMLELAERGRKPERTSRAMTRSTTLVGSAPPPADDSASSLCTFETRSIGWNRVGSCLGARAF
ncbi:hypothetical protein B0H16DRAFT_1466171 [Mycena metata]|uniref:Uncharacterized protein n=1 Tax=Mycena metata TaxID=1033252 RepID=A0AAD7I8M0_9AGAR|nr:hypothetical protein B0H16DRAFT_1466171 [Mycena metata]